MGRWRMDMDEELVTTLRERREELRREAKAARLAADAAEDAYHRADHALAAVEDVQRELDDFNASARNILN